MVIPPVVKEIVHVKQVYDGGFVIVFCGTVNGVVSVIPDTGRSNQRRDIRIIFSIATRDVAVGNDVIALQHRRWTWYPRVLRTE